MWDVLVRTPRGSLLSRKLNLLLATFLMVSFGYIFAVAPTAVAAPDAEWVDQSIRYNDHTYEAVSDTANLPSSVANSPAVYRYTDSTVEPAIVHFIYFGKENAQSEKEATYIRYTLNPPNDYSNETGKKTLAITPVPEDQQLTNEDTGVLGSSCTVSGIGWLVCPLMNGIAEGMDFIFLVIRGFLVVQPMTTNVDNPVYRIWQVSRDIANVAFVIGFLVIIYNYIVGGGMAGYEIRRIIPRLVVAAVLINISYVLCAIAVDASNIAGYGVNQLFETVRDNTLPGSVGEGDINWTSVSAWILAGGAGALAGAAAFATGPGFAGLWLVLATFLFGAALVLLVTFLILAARQAIIIIAIAVAPLAFAAYILPNTEKWFERWRDLFFTMLIMFPAFAAVFGGAQLAGEVIIRMAAANGSIEMVLLGLGVMVAPLAITPLLLKLGGGLLNRFGGIINNPQKGLYDRVKNHNKDRMDDIVARKNAANAQLRAENGFKRRKIPGTNKSIPGQLGRRYAAHTYAKNNYRSTQRKLNEEAAENAWHNQTGRWGYDSHLGEQGSNQNLLRRNQSGRGNLDTYKRDNQLTHGLSEANHAEHWQNTLNSDSTRRAMLTNTRMSENRAKVIESAHAAQDDRSFQVALNTDTSAKYANLKNMQIQASVDSGVANIHKAAVESAGKLALSTTVSGDRELHKLKVDTYATEKQAEVLDNTLQKKAEANWHSVSRNDEAVQQLRLKEMQASDDARRVEEQWNTLVENIAAKGGEAPGVAASSKSIANSIMGLRQDIQIESKAQEAAKVQQGINLMSALKQSQEAMIDPTKSGDPSLLKRAAGIGGQQAEARIFAQATKSVVDTAVAEVQDNRYLLSQYTRGQLHNVFFKGRGLQNEPVTTEMQQAAMYELLQKKGNNDDAQVIRNAISDMGMMVDETTGKFYEPQRESDGRIKLVNGYPAKDMSREITDSEEIGRRRDWQQFFADAAGKSPHRMTTLSGTDRSDSETGTMVSTVRAGFMRDAIGGKFGPEKMLKADIDELKWLYTDMTDPAGEYSRLNATQKAQVNEALVSAVVGLQKHPTYKGQIDDRNRGVMNQIVALADPSYATGIDSNGKPVFYVEDDKSIAKRPDVITGNEKTFAAPVKGDIAIRSGNDWQINHTW